MRLTHVRERVPARLPGGLAGWGTPPRSGPRGLRSRSREVGYIQIEAHGAQHPGVLYFSLRLKLLAPELLAHPSSRQLSLCYPASLKLHCGRASCMSGRRCIEQEPACSSSRGEELTVLAGSMRRTTGSHRDRDEELVGRAGKPVAEREGKESAETKQQPVHWAAGSLCRISDGGREKACTAAG